MSEKSPSKDELIEIIAHEGHSYPHYSTCKTCEEDFDRVVEWARNQTLADVEKIIEHLTIQPIHIRWERAKSQGWNNALGNLKEEIKNLKSNSQGEGNSNVPKVNHSPPVNTPDRQGKDTRQERNTVSTVKASSNLAVSQPAVCKCRVECCQICCLCGLMKEVKDE